MESIASLVHEVALLRNETRAELARLEQATASTYTLMMAIVLFLMQAGFSMLEAGTVRERAVRDVLFKNMLDTSVGAIAWFLIGYLLSSDSGNAFIGMPDVQMTNETVTPFAVLQETHGSLHGDAVSRYFLSFMFAASSATIVSGAIAERTQQRAYILSSSLMVAVVYPVVAHWLWSDRGWLSRRGTSPVLGGAFDFAGGGVVHVTGGVMALVAARIVGPRAGRFAPPGQPRQPPVKMQGNSAVLVALGTVLLWIGWLGFNCGSIADITRPGAATLAAQTAVRTTLAGSAGSLMAVAIARVRKVTGPMGVWGVWSLEHACNGLLAGLVSITAGAPVVSEFGALAIGAVGGALYYSVSYFVLHYLHIDDVIDAFAVHGACGLWSLVAVGLIADGSMPPSRPGGPPGVPTIGAFAGGGASLLAAEIVAGLSIALWASAFSVLIFLPAKRLGLLRIPDDFELTGIDIAELGRPAYALRDLRNAPPQDAVARPIALSPAESAFSSAVASSGGGVPDVVPGVALTVAAREAAAHDTGAPPVPVPVPVAAAPLEVETIAIAEGRPVHLDVPVGSEVHTG